MTRSLEHPPTESLTRREHPFWLGGEPASSSTPLREVNRSKFGLQAGVFTADLERSLRAFDALEVGGVMINDVPTWRIDHLPYGGVKDSGLGREAPRYTVEEMTELKLMVINRLR